MEKIKIGVVGAGAVGCTVAALLAKAGYDVELAKIYKSQFNLTNNVALTISGEFGDHNVLVNTCKGIDKFSSLKDFIFIFSRANDAKKSCSIALKYLTPNGKIVTLQNVFTLDEVLEVVPRDKLLGLIIGWSPIKNDYNNISILSNGINVIGPFCPNLDSSLLLLKQVLNNITPTYITNNLVGLAISRLIINSAISSLGCITGARLGNLMEIKNVKKLFEGLFKEDMAIAKARGIKITPYCKEFDYYELMKPGFASFLQRRRKLSQLGRQNPYVVSSILRNIENNKQTEIDYTIGYFIKQGKKLNIKTPLNSRLYEMISDIENHEIGIFPDNAMDYYLRKPHKYINKEIDYVNWWNKKSKCWSNEKQRCKFKEYLFSINKQTLASNNKC